MKIHIVKEEQVKTLVPMDTAITALHNIFLQYELGTIKVPARNIIGLQSPDSLMLIMPSHNLGTGLLVVKVSSIIPANLEVDYPLIHSLMLVLNEKDGQIKALVDGSAVTKLRTGALCGLAAQLLAKKTASNLAIIGTGKQSYSIAEAICSVRTISKIKLYSRTLDKAKLLKEYIEDKLLISNVILAESSAEAVKDADIICTATSNINQQPVINFEDISLHRNVLIIAIGGASIEAHEVPIELYSYADVIVEDVATAVNECGEISTSISENKIVESDLLPLGTIIKNGVNLKRNLVIFRSVGMAIEDLAIVQEIFNYKHMDDQCQAIIMD